MQSDDEVGALPVELTKRRIFDALDADMGHLTDDQSLTGPYALGRVKDVIEQALSRPPSHSGVDTAVSNDDAIKFLETACRNWDYVRFSREDVVDVAWALSSFLRKRLAALSRPTSPDVVEGWHEPEPGSRAYTEGEVTQGDRDAAANYVVNVVECLSGLTGEHIRLGRYDGDTIVTTFRDHRLGK